MPDNHYINPRLAALYDLDSGWGEDREFYLRLAGAPPQSILDLGCGTGLICDAYAALGHNVTGADPAPAMLDVARRKPHGSKIKWVEAAAQDFSSPDKFDLIIMTGHAFQAVTDDADIAGTFSAIHRHLKPDGRVVFESRNPAIDWKQRWNYSMTLQTPSGPVREERRFGTMQDGLMIFELQYTFQDGETALSESRLRFLSRSEIEARLRAAGLEISGVFGDWSFGPFDVNTSEEMVFSARIA